MSEAGKIVVRGTVRHQDGREQDLRGLRVNLLGAATEGPSRVLDLDEAQTDERGQFLLQADPVDPDVVPWLYVCLYDRRFVAQPYFVKLVYGAPMPDEEIELTLEPRDRSA